MNKNISEFPIIPELSLQEEKNGNLHTFFGIRCHPVYS